MINPAKYASTRNHQDGAVTYLSPYISRGVISTRQIYEHIKRIDLTWYKKEKLIQELAWRDYWQQVWIDKKEGIFKDIKNKQSPIANHEIPWLASLIKLISHAYSNSLEFELLEHLFSADSGENLASLEVNDSNAFFSLLISLVRAAFR